MELQLRIKRLWHFLFLDPFSWSFKSEWGSLTCVSSLIQAVLWSTSLRASLKLTIVHCRDYKSLQQCAGAWWIWNCDSCHGCLFRYSCAISEAPRLSRNCLRKLFWDRSHLRIDHWSVLLETQCQSDFKQWGIIQQLNRRKNLSDGSCSHFILYYPQVTRWYLI